MLTPSLITGVAILAAVLALGVPLLATQWHAKELARNNVMVYTDPNLSIQFDVPEVIAASERASTMNIVVTQREFPVTDYFVNLTVTFPADVLKINPNQVDRIEDMDQVTMSRTLFVSRDETLYWSTTVFIKNRLLATSSDWFDVTHGGVNRLVTYTVRSYFPDGIATRDELTDSLSLLVESANHAALMDLFDQINTQNPLLPFLLACISAVWALNRWRQDSYQKAADLMRDIRLDLSSGRIDQAESKIEKVRSIFKGSVDSDDLATAEGLLGITKDTSTRGNLEQVGTNPIWHRAISREWIREVAGVLTYVSKHAPVGVHPRYVYLDALMQCRSLGVSEELLFEASLNLRRQAPAEFRRVFHLKAKSERELANAFPASIAEDELDWLFYRKDAHLFWAKQKSYIQCTSGKNHSLIFGAVGTGRTAMAQAIGSYAVGYPNESTVLSCYTRGLPRIGEIQRLVSKRFLQDILDYPTYLTTLNKFQLEEISSVLCSILNRGMVMTALMTRRDERVSEARESPRALQLEQQQATFMFQQIVANSRINSAYTVADWAGLFQACANSVQFDTIHIAIDSQVAGFKKWFATEIEPCVEDMFKANIYLKVFAQDSVELPDTVTNMELHFLEWDEDELRTMAKHRLEQVHPHVSIDTKILPSPDALNPRHYIDLCKSWAVINFSA